MCNNINPFNVQIVAVINSGYRLPPPSGCPRFMYKLMIRCWYVYLCTYVSTACNNFWNFQLE